MLDQTKELNRFSTEANSTTVALCWFAIKDCRYWFEKLCTDGAMST